jgi:hypothetical protein
MIYALSRVVCHRIHSGGANGDVQQRWAAASAPPNQKELSYYCACHLEPSPCCIQDSMPWGTKACFEVSTTGALPCTICHTLARPFTLYLK